MTQPAHIPYSEAYVLPALTRFQGHPEIDDQGNIVYRFPAMEATSGVYREVEVRRCKQLQTTTPAF